MIDLFRTDLILTEGLIDIDQRKNMNNREKVLDGRVFHGRVLHGRFLDG